MRLSIYVAQIFKILRLRKKHKRKRKVDCIFFSRKQLYVCVKLISFRYSQTRKCIVFLYIYWNKANEYCQGKYTSSASDFLWNIWAVKWVELNFLNLTLLTGKNCLYCKLLTIAELCKSKKSWRNEPTFWISI